MSERTKAPVAASRRAWPVRVFRLGAEPPDDLSATSTPEQRLGMMWPLALEAFALARQGPPEYRRVDAAVVLRRLGE